MLPDELPLLLPPDEDEEDEEEEEEEEVEPDPEPEPPPLLLVLEPEPDAEPPEELGQLPDEPDEPEDPEEPVDPEVPELPELPEELPDVPEPVPELPLPEPVVPLLPPLELLPASALLKPLRMKAAMSAAQLPVQLPGFSEGMVSAMRVPRPSWVAQLGQRAVEFSAGPTPPWPLAPWHLVQSRE